MTTPKDEFRCKCWHQFIARNGNWYDARCSRPGGHPGHCKWFGIRASCDDDYKNRWHVVNSESSQSSG